MFTVSNTKGFSTDQLIDMNKKVIAAISEGDWESNAMDNVMADIEEMQYQKEQADYYIRSNQQKAKLKDLSDQFMHMTYLSKKEIDPYSEQLE